MSSLFDLSKKAIYYYRFDATYYSLMYRLFIDDFMVIHKICQLRYATHHYVTNVLRISLGDSIIVFNHNEGEWLGKIYFQDKKKTSIMIKKKLSQRKKLISNVVLAFSLLKKQNNHLIVQKATELNVLEIYPMITDRTITKDINLIKCNTVVVGACQQSGRLTVPIIHKLSTLKMLILSNPKSNILVCSNQDAEKHIVSVLNDTTVQQRTIIIIGPEGGFSHNELRYLNHNRITSVRLGPLILKSETAAISALSIYQAIYNLVVNNNEKKIRKFNK